ncbi:hypothetical protein GGR57DRAFT_492427 [Xylariaceae sp. FL1272]|nr:hypothetical protein GGR57DRAFT_492427 [Xylariaceae sp. FL1272]
MLYSEHDSLNFAQRFEEGPYSSSLASSASSSSTSVCSVASSQTSDNTSISALSESAGSCDLYSQRSGFNQAEFTSWTTRPGKVEVPQQLRQNPRRTSNSATTRTGPPTLTRQSDRKLNFVDNLVDSSTQIVEAIWPLASVFHRQELGHKAAPPLRTFIQETLRRSRTSYSTLQVALYYLILIKPHVPDFDFTMEQPEDNPTIKALQCGRRMFLAALILASKYLQDKNYSARAWSRICGLPTHEINSNEMVFLSAINWKLHITDLVFKRWTEIILKHTPSQPPSSGSPCFLVSEKQCQNWKNLILQLNAGLDNIEDLIPVSPSQRKHLVALPSTPISLASTPRVRSPLSAEANDATPTPRSMGTPTVMEPVPATAHTPGRLAPALGLLPTPRLTPQSTGFCTPAVSAATAMLGGRCSMGFAMAQAAQVSASQNLDRWPSSISTSPRSHMLTRRPSLANSVSTASSPESMMSDTSRTSRSSSISSASSLVSAPFTKLDVQARCRNAKLYGERYSMKPAIASVPEDYEENCITSSPESYTGTVGKDLYQMSLETPLGHRDCEVEDAANAARALQDLHNYRTSSTSRPNLKRSHRLSTDSSLQENVRVLLNQNNYSYNGSQTPVQRSHDGRKRICCAAEAASRSYSIPSIHPAVGGAGGPGMWEGILNN